jgi:hypothetical protein
MIRPKKTFGQFLAAMPSATSWISEYGDWVYMPNGTLAFIAPQIFFYAHIWAEPTSTLVNYQGDNNES